LKIHLEFLVELDYYELEKVGFEILDFENSEHKFDETKEEKNETRRTNLALWDSRRLEVKQ
ncbi:hypothetical protein Tco_0943807, partial [Tanacetum coccineum]